MRWNNGVIHQKEHGRWHRWTIQIHSGSLGFGSSFIHENSHLSEFTPKLHTDPLCMPPCRSIILCCSFLSTLSNSSDAVIVLPHFAAPSTSSECMPNSPQQHGLAQDGWVQLVHNEPSKLSTCFFDGLTFIVSTCLWSHQELPSIRHSGGSDSGAMTAAVRKTVRLPCAHGFDNILVYLRGRRPFTHTHIHIMCVCYVQIQTYMQVW